MLKLNFYLTQVIFIVSTSLAYITITNNKRKAKITWDEKLTTAYILTLNEGFCSKQFGH